MFHVLSNLELRALRWLFCLNSILLIWATLEEMGSSRTKSDPKGRNVQKWVPGMESFRGSYSTRTDLRHLKGMKRENALLATTYPLHVVVSRKSPFSLYAFHSFLYSHGTTCPFRPLVVRGTSMSLSSSIVAALISASRTRKSVATWEPVDVELANQIPKPTFAVTDRQAVEFLGFEAEDRIIMPPLFSTTVSPPETSTSACRSFRHVGGESIFAPLPHTSLCFKLDVPQETVDHVTRLNSVMSRHYPSSIRYKLESFEGEASSLSAAKSYEVTLHNQDMLFIPRGWSYSVQLMPQGGVTSGERSAIHWPTSERFAKQDWEPEEDDLELEVERVPAAVESKVTRTPPALLRHVFSPFPTLTEAEARRHAVDNLYTLEGFYQKTVRRPEAAAPPKAATGSETRW